MATEAQVERVDDSIPATVGPNAFIASAVRMSGTKDYARRAARLEVGWHKEAWYFYDTIGEYRFCVNWVGNTISRAKLFAARRVGKRWEPLPDKHKAQQAVRTLTEGAGGDSQLLTAFGINETVAGDCFLVGHNDGGDDVFTVAATDELTWTGKNYRLNGEILRGNVSATRIWRPHPRDRRYSDSPTRAVLPILAEIDRLTKHVAAQVDSRLAGAGIYWVPQEMTLPGPDGTILDASALVAKLQEAMTTAIKNREDASALVPIILTAPGELIDKAKHDTFWTELDEHTIELRTEAIRRLGLGMDMPPEILTGVGETNHWNAWSIDESAIKIHAIPPLELIVSSLTAGYLDPYMQDQKFEDWRDYAILADTSEMRARPNRSREAIELNDRGVVSDRATVREIGLAETDMMTPDEQKQWLLRKVASGSSTPEQVEAALRQLGVDLRSGIEPGGDTREARPDPSLDDHPRRDPPELPGDEQAPSAGLLLASEALVYRALERAGNRIKNRLQYCPKDIPAYELYQHAPPHPGNIPKLLEDAWTLAPRVIDGIDLDPEEFVAVLDGYTRYLLTEGVVHDRELLEKRLATLGSPVAA